MLWFKNNALPNKVTFVDHIRVVTQWRRIMWRHNSGSKLDYEIILMTSSFKKVTFNNIE